METNSSIRAEDVGKLILRVGFAGLLLPHGISMVMHGLDPILGLVEANGLPRALGYGVLVGEIVAPILILIGLFTRLGGAIIAVNMGVAVWLVHRADFFTVNAVGGWELEPAASFFLAGLALCFLGAGRISVSRGKGWLD
jgi:putative oxidoreductase